MKNIADKLFFFTLIVMLSLPYTRVVLPALGEVNFKSHLLVILLIILISKWFIQSRVTNDPLLNYTAVVFLACFYISVIFGRDLPTVASQMFEYAPFIIACLILATGSSLEYDDVAFWIASSVALSGALAAYFFYFATQWMPSDFSTEADFAWGRLPWRSGANVLLALGVVLFSYRKLSWSLPLVAVVGLVPAILTFSRTLMLGILVFIAVALVYGVKSKSLLRQSYFYFLLLAVSAVALSVFDFDNVLHNIEHRIIGTLSMSSNITGHVSDREILYAQYFEVFSEYPWLGAGFGVPFSTDPEVSYYADVTLVSFALPFGISGLVMFYMFVSRLWSMLNSVTEASFAAPKYGLKLTIIVGLLISLNDDIWSHKEFSIIIALLVASFVNCYGRRKGIFGYVV